MGMGIQSNSRKGSRRKAPMAEINVTPLVDVMLVLLIIFMVTAPLMTVGIPVDLPKTKAPAMNENVEPLTISVTKDGDVYVQETKVDLDTLPDKVRAITESKPDTRIFVRGDQTINYGRIVQVMGALHNAGFNKVALLAEFPKPKTE
jgi:biopolymer transport protein TolR